MHLEWLDIHQLNIFELFRLNYASVLAFIVALFYLPLYYM
jgi:hypothetical protein